LAVLILIIWGERNCFVYLVVPVVVDCNEEIPRQKCSHSQEVEHQPNGPENKCFVPLNQKEAAGR
jgi:hypothetical protein